ncbi:MAG: elongation factor EF-2 [Candidatus Hodgkinia cicadicola]|nr:MAG: elongation factor EF-2 [Candidatus Hodgkinia cicadicola]
MISFRNYRNFGIMAHIDAGKTTITERLLFYTGKLHKTGEVHEGTAAMDWMPQEQERGITITSASTTVFWNDAYGTKTQLNIIDTPGHIDFTAEVERSIRVLDGAVVVLDANAGVEPQTEAVWRQADKYNLPRLVFCNKMDKLGADYRLCTGSLVERLNAKLLLLQLPIGQENEFSGVIDIVNMRALYWTVDPRGVRWVSANVPESELGSAKLLRERVTNSVIDLDHRGIDLYLKQGELSAAQLKSLIRLATATGKAFPVLCGSAFKNKAIQSLLTAIVDYLPSPDDVPPVEGVGAKSFDSLSEVRFACYYQPVCALAFKIVADVYVGSLTYVRVYSGVLIQGDTVYNASAKQKEKVVKLLKMHANSRAEASYAGVGEIVAVAGLKATATGDTLCDLGASVTLSAISFPSPVIQIAIESQNKLDQEKLALILDKYLLEDPTLHADVKDTSGQVIISGMGELHLDVIVDRIRREHALVLKTGQPQVAYKETIMCQRTEEYTHRKQTGGAGQYAKVKIVFEPSLKDEFEFESKIVGGVIPKEYIPGVKKGLESVLAGGPATGHPMIRIKATLIDGGFHEVDSSALAFEIAARQCFKQAVCSAGARVLEPVMRVEVGAPDEYANNIISDLSARRGHVLEQVSNLGHTTVFALVPLINVFKYIDTLRSLSKGRASYSMRFDHYA